MEKTATKTLDELIDEFNSKPYGVSLEKFIYDYFYIHRSSEYKQIIKAMLPHTEYVYDQDLRCYGSEAKTVVIKKAIIDRAKKLI